ncbi:VOC family protein [Kribbella sp. CA-293567]|uniref:VOC family protein n=1 Tax=Kribbella sp. CA-293567 TaxID=3002436 RepID=UPI0022DDD78F|nr:VOC family protein [Kribbella sp. CA-293567]WBQ05695.1 VOC family protein [Kribbella sp. CA-293567]
MVEQSVPWPPGTPIWVDLAADDAEAAAGFYAGLFGWDCERQTTRDYWICKLDGEDVGGIGPKQPGTEHLPSRWTTYLATDQLDRTLEAVAAHQGTQLLKREIEDHGRMALAADPNGAIFGLWQATDHIGTERTTGPGRLVWSEALSEDFETSRKFYTSVFGYRAEEIGGYSRYAALYAADKPVVGTGELHPDFPAGTPPHWLPYFAVSSTDHTIDQVSKAGGKLLGAPLETDFGRMAVLDDPQGARFAAIQLG